MAQLLSFYQEFRSSNRQCSQYIEKNYVILKKK